MLLQGQERRVLTLEAEDRYCCADFARVRPIAVEGHTHQAFFGVVDHERAAGGEGGNQIVPFADGTDPLFRRHDTRSYALRR